jgi:hypothetical protein
LVELPDLAEPPDFAELPDLAVLAEDPVEGLGVVCAEPESDDRSTVVACAAPGRVTPMPSAVRTLAAPAAAVTDRSLAWLRFRAATAARFERLKPPWLPLLDAGIVSLSVCVHTGRLRWPWQTALRLNFCGRSDPAEPRR